MAFESADPIPQRRKLTNYDRVYLAAFVLYLSSIVYEPLDEYQLVLGFLLVFLSGFIFHIGIRDYWKPLSRKLELSYELKSSTLQQKLPRLTGMYRGYRVDLSITSLKINRFRSPSTAIKISLEPRISSAQKGKLEKIVSLVHIKDPSLILIETDSLHYRERGWVFDTEYLTAVLDALIDAISQVHPLTSNERPRLESE